MENIAVKSLSRENIRQYTVALRKYTGVHELKHFCVLWWLENKFLPEIGFDLDVREHKDMVGHHGLTDHGNKLFILRDDVYEGAKNGVGRDRGTVIHEAGHCCFHTPDRILYGRSFAEIPRYMDPEWQAKAFAGEFLVPVHLLTLGMSAQQIAFEFGVSKACAEFQLKAYEYKGFLKTTGSSNSNDDPVIGWIGKDKQSTV